MAKVWLFICTFLCIIVEIPLAIKCRQAINNFEITRQVAIIVLMLIVALFGAGIYKLGLIIAGLG